MTRRIPGMEVVRFANSGTEATMNAVRVARAFTGRTKIAKFEGAYHGTHDWVLVSVAPDPERAGSRKRPKSVASSSGIPPTVMKHVVVLPWNDADGVREDPREARGRPRRRPRRSAARERRDDPAARRAFSRALREVTQRLGILLVFDEVISFRIAPGGAQERFGIAPDLTTLGKIIGGGLAVGAFGGRADVMNYYDPRGGRPRSNQGGTFNANPLTMAGGVATMEQLTPEAYERLDALGDRLRERRAAAPETARLSRPDHRRGLAVLAALDEAARSRDYRSARPDDPQAPLRDVHGAGQRGRAPVAARPRRLLAAMTDADVDRFVEALGRALDRAG